MKWVFCVEYDGTLYYGWQKQKLVCSVQECIEKVFSKIANHKINIICSGRTDRGVHAIGQVAHFFTSTIRSHTTWLIGANSLLPSSITVIWIKSIPESFNARFSTLSRKYRYVVFNNINRSSFFYKYSFHIRNILNIKNMQKASNYIIGTHDFSSFRSVGCQSMSSYRTIFSICIFCYKNFVIFDIIANSFLYHMVRNIIGCLLLVGLSKKNIVWFKDIVKKKYKTKDYATAPAHGLYFFSAKYPSYFNLPSKKYISNFFDFLINI